MSDDPFGDAPASDGPRKLDVLRHVRASIIMRAKALVATSPGRNAQCLAEADRLMSLARDMAQADEDAAAFERRVRSSGGAWFPKDGL